jgi:hypothetical protein
MYGFCSTIISLEAREEIQQFLATVMQRDGVLAKNFQGSVTFDFILSRCY